MNKLLNEGGVYCVVAGDMRDLLLPIKNGKNKTCMSFSVFCNFPGKVACHCSIPNLIAWTIIHKLKKMALYCSQGSGTLKQVPKVWWL